MSTRKVNGASVRAIREAAKVMGSQLAIQAGMSHAALINIESGRRQASAEKIEALAAALGCSVDAITYVIPACATCAQRDAA